MNSTKKKEKLAQMVNNFVIENSLELGVSERYVREIIISEIKLQSKFTLSHRTDK
jgi:hypothetical protein